MITKSAREILQKNKGKRRVVYGAVSNDDYNKNVNGIKESLRDIIKDSDNILNELNGLGVNTARPTKRSECPNFRPCPFVSCDYHLYLEVKNSGAITINYPEIEPEQMIHSCALDVAESNPDGLSFSEIGDKLNLTRERVRQIQEDALCKSRSPLIRTEN